MKPRIRLTMLAALLCAGGAAQASCPPLSAYRVTNVSAEGMAIGNAIDMLLAGTPWKGAAIGPSDGVKVTFRGVSGPLDQVLSKVVEAAGRASTAGVSMTTDGAQCMATVSITSLQDAPLAMVDTATGETAPATRPMHTSEVLRAGATLSEALSDYAERKGWSLRWQLDDDYMLDVDLPIPPMDLIDGVTYVVRAYQAQGGLVGAAPRFARSNNVVVIEKMRVRESGL